MHSAQSGVDCHSSDPSPYEEPSNQLTDNSEPTDFLQNLHAIVCEKYENSKNLLHPIYLGSRNFVKIYTNDIVLDLLTFFIVLYHKDIFLEFLSHLLTLIKMVDFRFHVCIIGAAVLFSKKLEKVFRSCCGLFIIGVVMVAQCRQIGVQQYFRTQNFFEPHSLVTDYAYGELTLLTEELLQSDLTMVFFYAPWDRESALFRKHFSTAALYYHEQVNFVSMNCWLPGSTCRKQYLFLKFPALVLFVRLPSNSETMNIPYIGRKDSGSLMSFIHKSLHPFKYINTKEELIELQIHSQSVVLAYFAQKDTNKMSTFYYTSLARLQFEHMTHVAFAATFNETLIPKDQASLYVFNWNDTLAYPSHKAWNVKNITDWVNRHVSFPYDWISMNDPKTVTLQNHVNESPTLFLMLPHDLFTSRNDALLLLNSVAMEYKKCGENSDVDKLIGRSRELLGREVNGNNFEGKCEDYLISFHKEYQVTSLMTEFPAFTHQCPLMDQSEWADLDQTMWKSYWAMSHQDLSKFVDSYFTGFHMFPFMKRQSTTTYNQSTVRTQIKKMTPSDTEAKGVQQKNEVDDLIDQLTLWKHEEICKLWSLSSGMLHSKLIIRATEVNPIEGLACKHNDSLNFAVIDSVGQKSLGELLGVPNATTVWIIDAEQHYILHEPPTLLTLSNFIHKYHSGSLQRDIFSKEIKPTKESLSINELNAKSYLNVTQGNGYHVVLHYSRSCGSCKVVSEALLHCKHLLGVKDLHFWRIDVSYNTMPWPYTFEEVPTLIFHPKFRKSETRIFNNTNGFSTKAVMTFILQNVGVKDRRNIAESMCDSNCRSKAIEIVKEKISEAQAQLDLLVSELTNVLALVNNNNIEIYAYRSNWIKSRIVELKSKLKELRAWYKNNV